MRNGLVGLAAAASLLAASTAAAEEPAGDWGGLLFGRIRVIFHLKRLADGRYSATTDSPDQGAEGVPVDEVDAGPDHLELKVSAFKAAYSARWDAQRRVWAGTLTQGRAMPLELHRLSAAELAALKPVRPQDEAAAIAMASFRPEEVRMANPAAPGVSLAGTFSTPAGKGPFPAVVLISGSGPQVRDEVVAHHRIFLVLAAELNRRGLAVLRYDKRGAGASSGDSTGATTADYASDATAAFRYLLTRRDVDPRRVGLIGHSEGGAVAPLVAGEDPRVAFVVLMAGPGLAGGPLLAKQNLLIAKASGLSDEAAAQLTSRNRAMIDAVAAARDRTDALAKVQSLAEGGGEAGAATGQAFSTPWMFYFLRYDPAPALKKVRAPVLAVAGSLDLQVPAKEDLAIIGEALKTNPDVTLVELPGLNHLFQSATTGGPNEYGKIEETIAPAALKVIGDWVAEHAEPTR